jgi:hypothetical protein
VEELAFEDVIRGPVILAFDGRVIELFQGRGEGSIRLHVREVTVATSGPGKNGRWEATVETIHRGGFKLSVEAPLWPQLEPLIRKLAAAAGST